MKFDLSFLINFPTVYIIFLDIFSKKCDSLSFFWIFSNNTTEPVQHERNKFSPANWFVPYYFIYLIFDINICYNDRHPLLFSCKCPRNVAYGPPKNAPVNFRRPIRTQKEVNLDYQHSQKNLQININVSLGGPHTRAENWFLSPLPLCVHTLKNPQNFPLLSGPAEGENV